MLDKNKLNERQTYSIRKITVGAVSVLIGLTFFGFSGARVDAATTNSQAVKSEQVENINHQQQPDQKASFVEQSKDEHQQAIKAEMKTVYSQLKTENETNQAIVPGKNNTTSGPKVNGQGKNAIITNVPNNGSVEYDYSITAKNKNNGQTQAVSAADAGKNNNAILVDKNAQDVEAHLTLKNTTSNDQMIGNSANDTNPHPNDEADLMINAWYESSQKMGLQISSAKAANVVFIQNGQVIENNALPVYYLAQNGTWYTYEEMMKDFGASAINNVRQIGFRGILPAQTTAQMNVPLVIDPTGDQFNEIDLKSYNDQSIYVRTYAEPKKLWTVDEVKNDPIRLVTRNQDGSYNTIDLPQLDGQLPKIGEVVEITNSGNILDPSDQTLYVGGDYDIKLSKIQAVIDKYGYSVDPQAKDLTTLMPVYSYNTISDNNLLVIHGLSEEEQNKRIFYVEVHQIIATKDETFDQGSQEAQDWNYHQGVTDVFNVQNPKSVYNGYLLENVPANVQDVQLVKITNENGNVIKGINGQTPAGKYIVTVSYRLNGSHEKDMNIENSYLVNILPVQQPQPGSPDVPATPPTPSQPVTPSTPVQPAQPTTPTENNNITPQPENTDKTNNVMPKGEKTNNPKETNKSHRGVNNEVKSETITPKGEKAVAHHFVKKELPTRLVSPKATVRTTKKVEAQKATAQKNTLPQTGEKQAGLGTLGAVLAAIAGIFGLAAFRKKS